MTSDDLRVALLEEMTVSVWPHAGMALNLSRNSAYEAAKRGDIPTIRIGGAIRVPTAALRKMLGMEPTPAAAPAAQRAA